MVAPTRFFAADVFSEWSRSPDKLQLMSDGRGPTQGNLHLGGYQKLQMTAGLSGRTSWFIIPYLPKIKLKTIMGIHFSAKAGQRAFFFLKKKRTYLQLGKLEKDILEGEFEERHSGISKCTKYDIPNALFWLEWPASWLHGS